MNNQIEPIDPLVTNNNFFYADQKMLDILVNNDIQDYLDYVREKQKNLKFNHLNQHLINNYLMTINKKEKINIRKLCWKAYGQTLLH